MKLTSSAFELTLDASGRFVGAGLDLPTGRMQPCRDGSGIGFIGEPQQLSQWDLTSDDEVHRAEQPYYYLPAHVGKTAHD